MEVDTKFAKDRIYRVVLVLRKCKAWELEESEIMYDHLAALLDRNRDDPRQNALGESIDLHGPAGKAVVLEDLSPRIRSVKANVLSKDPSHLRIYLQEHTAQERITMMKESLEREDYVILAALERMDRSSFDELRPSHSPSVYGLGSKKSTGRKDNHSAHSPYAMWL